MSPATGDDGPARAADVPGRRAAIVAAHWLTIGVSSVVFAAALGSLVVGDGPRGSSALGFALMGVTASTVLVGWTSLRAFQRTDRPQLLRMGLVGAAWMGVTLAAAALAPPT